MVFAAHVPALAVVGALNDTGIVSAVVLTAVGLAGPFFAMRAFSNPRHVSIIFGVTAMYMGALLVHFGRGLWTIEMHFYFFVALALLAVFANPAVIVVAAATVAVHHLLFWFIAPQSVFNYDAPLTSVLLHALFVVLESVAACFVARSFFDNVIGLERIVAARTHQLDVRNREMALVFDHVNQGFLTVQANGTLLTERSKMIDRCLGSPQPQDLAADFFDRVDPEFGTWFRLGWDALIEDVLPREVSLHQLPHRFARTGSTYEVHYQPIDDQGRLAQVLVIITDVTERVRREAIDSAQKELINVFERLMRDRVGFAEFMAEGNSLVRRLEAPRPRATRCWPSAARGNCSVFGLTSVATACHEAEQRLEDESVAPGRPTRHRLSWASASERIITFLGGERVGVIELEEAEIQSAVEAIRGNVHPTKILELLESWKHEPISKRFHRLGEQAQSLATRMHKGSVTVDISAGANPRLPQATFAPLFASLVHVVRNAVDHGFEKAETRLARGKGAPKLTLAAHLLADELVISIADDGAGIDWASVSQAAQRKGLPTATREDLTDALFADGLSTKAHATEISGRGVGMSAVRQACSALGGRIVVRSSPDEGTTVELHLPRATLVEPAPVRAAA